MRTVIVLLVFIIWGCNHDGYHEQSDERGASCSVSGEGLISCPDGTSYQVPQPSAQAPGHDGVDGRDGEMGIPGPTGPTGPSGQTIVGPRGPQGEPGATGAVGPAGIAGTSCTVSEVGLITCGDTSYQIPAGPSGSPGPSGTPGQDGTDGQDGVDGIDGNDGADGIDGAPGTPGTVIVPVFPCPTLSGAYPEVLLCISNKLYAVFAPGNSNVRYVEVGPGNYRTTDGRSCNFSVISGCNIQ